jgi:UDP-N-acetylmuramoylalanine--D-glutamate ligase
VIGAGASGLAATRLLVAAGVEVRIYDRRSEVPGLPTPIETHLGVPEPPDAAFAGIDLLVLSPGVDPRPLRSRCATLAAEADIHGELSLGLYAVAQHWPPVPVVLITGTNGKSTVTAMVGALLAQDGRAPFTGGNLGTPLCQLALEVAHEARPRPGALVLECSSYQLETLRSFPTDVAMVLNVSPDHLDRYESLEDYALTKGRIFSGLGEGGLALLHDPDPFCDALQELVPPSSRCLRVDGLAAPRVGTEQLELESSVEIPRDLLRIPGRHNALNALFACATAIHLGVSAEDCAVALASFEGLPHRMAPVEEIDGVAYLNDSKATNVASVLASLGGFERPFVLIAGGQAKGDDPRPLTDLLRAGGRGLVTLGEASERFAALAPADMPCEQVTTMEEAVRRATAMARKGDAVVLSPACASWDMYDSYAHRGREFAEAVARIKASASS